ncbi:MAG: Uma2 family endonuclease [Labilithrix sp.]|nr:Uma2 family endonuclease [Labilithrix sp.]MCW5811760.1 Uma2 family endonuclease [Labilithrix sp.]
MSSAVSTPFVSLEDFLEMEPEDGVRLEWCAGIVHAMSGGSPDHSRLGARVIGALLSIAGEDCTVFDANADLWVDAAQFFGRADASLVCGALQVHSVKRGNRTLGEAITNPVVIVEVLSPSTETRDRGEKFVAYKQLMSLEEYVLVSQDQRHVEVRRRTSGGWRSDVVAGEGTIAIHGAPVDLDAIYGRQPRA